MLRVLGEVHRDERAIGVHLLAELIDLRADVIALRRERQFGNRTANCIHGRERLVVVQDRKCFLVSRDRDDIAMRQPHNRAARAQRIEIGIGVIDQRRVGEEVDLVDVGGRTANRWAVH